MHAALCMKGMLPAAGEKLIDHLKKWLEPEKLLAVQHSWDPGQECQIAAAILDLFHLLLPHAVKSLETSASHPPRTSLQGLCMLQEQCSRCQTLRCSPRFGATSMVRTALTLCRSSQAWWCL